MHPTFTHTAAIAGADFTFCRPTADFPSAEVVVYRGAVRDDRPDAWVNTQYGNVDGEGTEPISAELLAAAREFQRLRHEFERQAQAAKDARPFPPSQPEPTGNPATTWMGQASMDAEESVF